MKLLICTQAIDKNHPILGFFHRWVEEFAKHCEVVHVICLQEGEHSLPANVHVHSLGKESGQSRLKYLWRFYRLIWKLRHEYDSVFVHMNQIYVILGAPLWRAFDKRIGLWYMHGSVPLTLRLAEKMTNVVFTGSPESFKLISKKVLVTGHGIDTKHFSLRSVQKDIDIITVGRLSPSKNLIESINVLSKLQQEGQYCSLIIIGKALNVDDVVYQQKLEAEITAQNLQSSVHFIGPVSQQDLPEYLSRAKVFLHTAQNGSLDKAILEAMAVGLPVVSSAPGSASLSLGEAYARTAEELGEQIKKVLESNSYHRPDYVNYVVEQHGLNALIPKIVSNL